MSLIRVLVLVLVVSGCGGSSSDGPPQSAPYIEGKLSAISSGSPRTILVEEVPAGNKASLRIPDATPIWRVTADAVLISRE